MHVSGFVNDSARERFFALYEQAMRTWPEHTRQDVETSFGPTATYRAHAGTGPPVILLHGGKATSASWAHLVPTLTPYGTVFAIDTLGDAGASIQQRPLTDAHQRAQWLDEVLAGLGCDRAHLIGLSYGGWMALNQAVHRPSRVASVTALEPARALTPIRAGFWLRLISTTLTGSTAAAVRYLAWCRAGRLPQPPMRDLLVSAMLDHRQRAVCPPQPLTNGQLRAITAPTLVILGGRSPVHNVQRAADRTRRLLSSARVEIVADAGHGLPADSPEAVGRLIRSFLRDVSSTA
ncbi:pimeloyl-ACP methyl ester carboxylesterase [Thermocatellispora tengchongensis]|uniref:Pimeloyl-ACP methyl ester carboxylesterase n=1 Tax=Thermocatellispora tengchongensis TaxID=1073253 RepID=A0A840PEF2_9ACTN|nr:alpha/beta hydrolase [Thermocatellispora tengchongensis]MBB5139804.1 pimeloyl-ACP methyl ester carboxylesterase [Thermocatellispora tengchongensis]